MFKVALVIGHSKCWAEGAVNQKTGLTEWVFNKTLVTGVTCLGFPDGFDVRVFERPRGIGGLGKVVQAVNEFDPHVAFSFHANASLSHKASGCEVLYWHKSERGQALAEVIASVLADVLGLRNRGAKPIKKGGRGWYFLAKVRAVAVILEPFFIDNDDDLRRALSLFSPFIDTMHRLIVNSKGILGV